MISKIGELLSSIRFWQLTAGLVLVILGYYELVPMELAQIIAGYLGISIAVRTIDKIGQ